MCNGVPEPIRSEWVQSLQKQDLRCLRTKINDASWRYVPTTYISAADDRVLVLKDQKWFAQRARDAGVQPFGGRAFDGELAEFTVEACHLPFLNKEVELADILDKVARG
jgi:hypothetical protein